MRCRVVAIATAVALAACTAGGIAQPTQPATRRAEPMMGPMPPEGPLKIVVLEATGIVRYRPTADAPFRPMAPGDELPEGSEIKTGPKSIVKVQVGEDQQITFDRLGSYQITRAAVENGVFQTESSMKYGRTRYEIEAAGRQHDAVVRSPTSTLAVRGTVTELYDQPPFNVVAVSYTGQVQFRDARRQVALGTRGGRKVTLDAGRNSAAETALASATVDPTIGTYARTAAEQRLIEQVIATGGVIGFDVPGGIPVVRGGTPLTFDANSTNFPGDGINFVLNWTGDADLNLTVALPKFGDIITPITGLNRGNTGGVTTFDHRGGPNGGFEIVFYPQNYPGSDCVDVPGPGNNTGTETYITSIDFISGTVADVKLDTFVRDPVTGAKVLVQRQEGSINQSIANAQFSPVLQTTNFVDDALCAPPPGSTGTAAARVAQRGTQALTGRDTIDRSCGGWQTMLAEDRARRAAAATAAAAKSAPKPPAGAAGARVR